MPENAAVGAQVLFAVLVKEDELVVFDGIQELSPLLVVGEVRVDAGQGDLGGLVEAIVQVRRDTHPLAPQRVVADGDLLEAVVFGPRVVAEIVGRLRVVRSEVPAPEGAREDVAEPAEGRVVMLSARLHL